MPRHRLIQFDAAGRAYLDYTDEEKARRAREKPIADDGVSEQAEKQQRRNERFDF